MCLPCRQLRGTPWDTVGESVLKACTERHCTHLLQSWNAKSPRQTECPKWLPWEFKREKVPGSEVGVTMKSFTDCRESNLEKRGDLDNPELGGKMAQLESPRCWATLISPEVVQGWGERRCHTEGSDFPCASSQTLQGKQLSGIFHSPFSLSLSPPLSFTLLIYLSSDK